MAGRHRLRGGAVTPPVPGDHGNRLSDDEAFIIYGALNAEEALTHPEMSVLLLSHPGLYLKAVEAARSSLWNRMVVGGLELCTESQIQEICAYCRLNFIPPDRPEGPTPQSASERTDEWHLFEMEWRDFNTAIELAQGSRERAASMLIALVIDGASPDSWWMWFQDYAECPSCANEPGRLTARERGLTHVSEVEVTVECMGCGRSPNFAPPPSS